MKATKKVILELTNSEAEWLYEFIHSSEAGTPGEEELMDELMMALKS